MLNCKTLALVLLLGLGLALGACQPKAGNTVAAGGDLVAAATASESDLKAVAKQMRDVGDAENKVAPDNSKYAKRLNKLIGKHMKEDGQDLNFKVYLTNDVNANATPDGSIRVYSGLMDLMNDDELLYVLGHEIGHVVEGHSLNAMRVNYAASGAIKVSGADSSALGKLLHATINAQFSQSQEKSADDYALAFMKKHKYNQQGAVTALKKLADLGSTGGDLLSSHPDPKDRAARMEKQIGKK